MSNKLRILLADDSRFFRAIESQFLQKTPVEILEADSGVDIKELHIGGAAATSRVWNQVIADVLEKKVASLVQSHTEVLGAAVLAGVSLRAYPDFDTAIEKTVVLGDVFTPDPREHEAYNALFPMYKKLYPEIQHHFEELATMDLPQVWINHTH